MIRSNYYTIITKKFNLTEEYNMSKELENVIAKTNAGLKEAHEASVKACSILTTGSVRFGTPVGEKKQEATKPQNNTSANEQKKVESTSETVVNETNAAKKATDQMCSFFPEIDAAANAGIEQMKAEQKRRNQKMKVDPIPVQVDQTTNPNQVPVVTMDLGPGAIAPQAVPNGMIPVQVAPQPSMPASMMSGNEAVFAKHKHLSYLEKDLKKAGHNPRFVELEGGLIAVFLDDKPEKSFTLDVAGKLFNKKHKWTPGIMPSNSGYEQVSWFSYDKENPDLFAWIDGAELDDKKDIINMKNRILNNYVNMLTITATGEDKTNLIKRLHKMVSVGVFQDFNGCRFAVTDYEDYNNFNLRMMQYQGYNVPAMRYDPNFVIDCHNGKVNY